MDTPLRDFYVTMPNLTSIKADLTQVPQQVRTALSFLRVVCPREIVTDQTAAKLNLLLPPQQPEHRGKRTLMLDLDETLVHCHPSPIEGVPAPDLHTRIEVQHLTLDAHVYVRPFAQLALEVFSHLFEVVVFTASASVYADRVLDFLDPDGRKIHHRLYRQHCTEIYGGHFKDLRRLGRRLDDCILVDNSPLALGLIPDNGIPISSWFGDDLEDTELLDLIRLLEMCMDSKCKSVPEFLIERFGFSRFLHYLRTTADVPGLENMPQTMQTGQTSGITTQVQR
jgi:Dullard-like phosphatase family protein